MIRVSIALLADDAFQKTFHQWQQDISRQYKFTPDNLTFRPHVSLKQSFLVTDLEGVGAYFDEFAAGVPRLVLTLTEVGIWTMPAPMDDMGVVFFQIAEQEYLRSLHDLLNRGLTSRFENTQAPFDGEDYRFHLTLAAGGAPLSIYEQIYAARQASWRPTPCQISALSMGLFDDDASEKGWQQFKLRPLPVQSEL